MYKFGLAQIMYASLPMKEGECIGQPETDFV